MDNHERAKQMLDILRRDLTLNKGVVDGLKFALDATEPKPEPKGRPAFLGDEVSHVEYGERYWVMSMSQVQPNIVMLEDASSDVAGYDSKSLIHPDGTPVSRIVEHRRPIPVSEQLPTEEDGDRRGKVLAFNIGGSCYVVNWNDVGFDVSGVFVAWLPCPERGGVE